MKAGMQLVAVRTNARTHAGVHLFSTLYQLPAYILPHMCGKLRARAHDATLPVNVRSAHV